MSMIRCDCCTGKKTIIGLGNIPRKCHVCKGVGFKQCDDLANVSEPLEDYTDTRNMLKAGLIVDDKEQDKVYNDSLPSKEQKKIEQSIRMKKAWAERKAKAEQHKG